jgi:hypothetical protein
VQNEGRAFQVGLCIIGICLGLGAWDLGFASVVLQHEFGLAGDYTNQTYGIVDPDTIGNPDKRDTLDVETEGRGFWNLDLSIEGPDTRFAAGNDLGLSTRSVREALNLSIERDLASILHIEAFDDAELRYYHRALPQLSDTGFQRSYLSNTTDLALDLDVTPALELSASEQVQLSYYPEPDSYGYDYLLSRSRLGLRQELGGISALDLEYDWSRRWAIAVDDQDYAEHSLDADLDWYFDNGPHVELENNVSRRAYAGRSRSYWEENPGVRFDADASSALSISLDDDARWTWYDSSTAVYNDLFENSLKFGLEWRATSELSFRTGPEWAAGRSLPAATTEDYREVSATAGADYMRAGWLWLSVEDRLGRRRYPLADSSFQSNYAFNEFNLMANWTIIKTNRGGLSLDGNVSISPEWHSDQTSNLATRIYTLELKYGL